jgi:hypothetical protein
VEKVGLIPRWLIEHDQYDRPRWMNLLHGASVGVELPMLATLFGFFGYWSASEWLLLCLLAAPVGALEALIPRRPHRSASS